MSTEFEKLKETNSQHCGQNYNMNFFFLNGIIKNQIEIGIIQLVLSYQLNDKDFFGSNKKIGEILFCSPASIATPIKNLRKKGYLDNQPARANKEFGGKTRYLKVNVDKLIEDFEAINKQKDSTPPIEEPTPEPQQAEIKAPNEEIEPIEQPTPEEPIEVNESIDNSLFGFINDLDSRLICEIIYERNGLSKLELSSDVQWLKVMTYYPTLTSLQDRQKVIKLIEYNLIEEKLVIENGKVKINTSLISKRRLELAQLN